MQQGHPKRRYPTATLHDVITKKTSTRILENHVSKRDISLLAFEKLVTVLQNNDACVSIA
jgi:hypothetical protein